MDFRFVDPVTDPAPTADLLATERLVRFAPTAWAYAPEMDAPPPAPPPGADDNHVTFGSFNNFAKASTRTLDLWAAVLRAVPGSRLLLKSHDLDQINIAARIRDSFARRDITPDRLELRGRSVDTRDHLAAYGEIDIALDTFPYNGTTTTCEALWMGVPVITLAGDRHAGRVGASLLKTVGFEAGITKTSEEFVTTARLMAENPGILRTIRRTLRDTVYRSSLCDNKTHARTLEDALRATWQIWCEQRCDRSDQGIIP
jgi:predicted O-linked N-acetylglucosamine transferase (SPINDLY family)